MIYSLFIERPRAGAAPVPYLMAKTKSLAEAEAWVAAPVLTAKAAANVREGDMFTARYPDTKLRNEHGPISRVAAFSKTTKVGIVACTSRGLTDDEVTLEVPLSPRESTHRESWQHDWRNNVRGDRLLFLAARAKVPPQVVAHAMCAAIRKITDQTLDVADAWARGKAPLADVRTVRDRAEAAAYDLHRANDLNAYSAMAASVHAYDYILGNSLKDVMPAIHDAALITDYGRAMHQAAVVVHRIIKLPEVLAAALAQAA